MDVPYWISRLLPMWEYICPKCRKEVKRNSHECSYCGERFPLAIRVPPTFLNDPKKLEAYVHRHIFPRVSEFERNYLTKYFTVLFASGFESGSLAGDGWDGTLGTAPTVVTTAPHHGAYHMRCATSGQKEAYETKSPYTTMSIRLYFRVVTLPPNDGSFVPICRLLNTAWGTIWQLQYRNTAGTLTLRLTHYFPSAVSADYTLTISTGVYYCLECTVVKGAATGSYTVYFNGSPVITQAGLDTSGCGTVGIICVGQWGASYDADLYIDCVVVADAYIGPEVLKGTIAIHAKLLDII